MTALKVGLIGLGSVAQITHLPVLAALADHFEVVAGCDVGLDFASAVGAAYHVPRVYASHGDMLATEVLDVVAVLNSDEYHSECAIAALDAGCHVLLEKPAALTPRQVHDIIAARDRSGRQVMVGYMRRHASAYAALKTELATSSDNVLHVAVRDIIGGNSYFIDQVTTVISPRPVSAHFAAEKAERGRAAVAEALGFTPSSEIASAYRLLLGLSSHDFSALRGLIGAPRAVLSAAIRGKGRFLSAQLDYGDFVATYESGIDGVGSFDATIEIFTGKRRFILEYDTPYIRHLPILLRSAASEGEQLLETVNRPSFRDPYTNQWLAFHAALSGAGSFSETLEDALLDIELAIEIARHL